MATFKTDKIDWAYPRKELIDAGIVIVVPAGTPYPDDYAEKHNCEFDTYSASKPSGGVMVMVPYKNLGGSKQTAEAGLIPLTGAPGWSWGGTHMMSLGKLVKAGTPFPE